jgi:hypothetical protein
VEVETIEPNFQNFTEPFLRNLKNSRIREHEVQECVLFTFTEHTLSVCALGYFRDIGVGQCGAGRKKGPLGSR